MKLWSKGLEPDKMIEEFTVGQDRDLDVFLARFDVEGSLAHIKMLNSIGLLSDSELNALTAELYNILEEINAGKFTIEPGVEDVHSQVEFMLTNRLGDVGKKIHSGRSRNDQVLVDIKLFMRHQLQQISQSLLKLFDTLQALSEKYSNVLMPGYTHMQVAMPSSFGLWFGAYAETLVDDMQMILAAYNIANQNPLGSAAGYGSSFPLDREMTASLLEFQTLHYNVVAAQMSRGKTERAVSAAIASVAYTLARFANDVCTYMCPNFGFVTFPDQFTTGSSIMPHKKNPDVFEIMRGRCNRLQSLPNEVALLTTNLPLGYNRDLQLLKDITFPAFDNINKCIDMCEMMLHHIIINENAVEPQLYDYMFTVEEVNRLTLDGMPFRDAYRKVGIDVNEGRFKANRQVNHTHIGSIGNLANDKIRNKMMEVYHKINPEKKQ